MPRLIYVLCGSTRFRAAFDLMESHLSLQGHIVLTVGCYGHSDYPDGVKFLTHDGGECNVKLELDSLHMDKIKMADVCMVINFGGYIGESLRREIDFAKSLGKQIDYMFQLA